MAGQGQGISVPISLQISNLQSIVNMLQSKLSNLKVGTAGFKSLQTIISTIQKDIDKLAIQTDKPFVSANQFTAADRAVNKLEEDLDKVQIAVSRIKFSDLELDPSQAAELKAFETQIESIKNSLKTVKETAKQAFLDSDVGKSWAENHKDAATQTLQQLTTTITKEVQKQTTELDQAKKAFSDYQQAIQTSKNINNFMSKRSGHQLSEATMGKELFNKIFKTDDTGEVSKFQNGGKTLLQQWLQQQFNLDSATVQSLTKGAGDAVVKAFAEVGGTVEAALKAQQIKLRNAATERKTATNNGSTLEAAVKEKAEKLNQAEAAQAQLVASNTSVSASEAQLRAELEQTKAQLADYKERLAQAVRTNPDWAASNKQANAALQQLRDTLNQTNGQFLQQQRVMQNFNSMKMAVVNFMGFNQVLNLTKTAIREAINHIKELDTVMNGIAIVTDMSTEDLWQQVDQYSKMAQAYGTTIKGAYEVSQIYYQQGLQTNDVLALTNETLKLAKVSGLDYATTTDYMTTALRGFKMEMSEASKVVDVYSNLAAHTAVSQEELAVAMSKTASSMESVGSTFEESSAMIGTMVAVTRESATNIGSALKSIASRYGEMKSNPSILQDAEGEAIAYNKVDAALQSVGITLKTTDGQFRSFTDVILELSEVWDQLESTQQRYIATQFAGNRQQSRFLALVSNPELLKANLSYAEESEDTGTLQALKALDSIESKLNQVQVAYQQFYTTLGAENVWKGLLDGTRNVIDTLNSLPKLFNKIPIGAIAVVGNIITLIKGLLTRGIQGIASIWTSSLNQSGTQATTHGQTIGRNLMTSIESAIKAGTPAVQAAINAALSLQQQTNSNIIPLNKEQQALFNIGNNNFKRNNSDWQSLAENYTKNGLMSQTEFASAQKAAAEGNEEAYRQAVERSNEAIRQQNGLLRENTNETNNNTNATNTSTTTKVSFFDKLKDGSSKLNRGLSATAMALTTVGMVLDKSSEAGRIASGVFTGLGGTLQTGTAAARVFAGDWSVLPQLVMGVINIINGFDIAIESPAEKLERLKKEAEELNNEAKEAKANYRILDNSIKKIDELKEKRSESTEAAEEYQTAVDDLAAKFPQMIAGFDETGNIILDTTDAERILAEAREKSKKATYDAAKAELDSAKEARDQAKDKLKKISVPSIISNGDFDVKGQIVEQRGNIIQKSLNTTLDTTLLSALEDSQKTLELFYQAAFDVENKKFKKGYEFLEKAKNPDTKKLELSRLEEYFTAQIDNLSAQEYEIYSALFSLETPQDIAKQFTETATKLSGLLDEGSTEDILNAYTELDSLLNLAARSKGFDETDLANARTKIENLAKQISEITDLNDTYSGYEKAVISAWQQSSAADQKAWDILSQSSTAAAMVTKQIAQNITDVYSEDYDKALNAGAETDWQEYQNIMANFIKKLDEDNLALFNSMTNDSSFSGFDIIETFSEYLSQDVQSYIIDWYTSGINSIQQRLNNHLASSLGNVEQLSDGNYEQVTDEMVKNHSEFYQQYLKLISNKNETDLTILEEKYLNNILNQYDSLIQNGYKSRANDFGEATLSLYTEIQSAPADIEKQLWQLINENGLTTLEGIRKIQDTIKNNESLQGYINEATLVNLYNNIIPNINLEIQTATSDLLENWENTSKELSSALSSGVSLKEADALITKAKSLGLKDFSLNNFQLVGDKLVLIGKSWEDYYSKLTENITSSTTAWQTRIDQANKALSVISNYGQSSMPTNVLQDYKAALEAIGFTDWNNREYVTQWGTLTEEGKQHIQDLINNTTDELTEYSRATAIAARQLLTAHETSQGIYKLVINETETNLSEDLEKLKTIAKGGTLGGNALDERAIKDSINNVYNTFISDVLSKGFENIHIEDYEGLVNAKDIQLKNISYEQFVKDYIDYTGASIDEANELLVQAIEKDQAKTSSSLLKDVQFRSPDLLVASLSALENLASTYGKDLGDLLVNAQQEGEDYILSISTLIEQGLDITQIDGFSDQVKDGVTEFFSKIVSLLENGLKGSLSSADATNLKKYASSIGFNGELDFTETADGLKLADQSAIQLQAHIASVNRIAGQTSFKVLNESLQETNEYYTTVSANMARIVELQEIIAKADDTVSEARLKEYQQELKVAKDILSVRSATEEDDTFKFMENDIPGAQKNPLNFYENWGKAIGVIQESAKTGYMSFQDWRNIITEINNEAALAGTTIEFAGFQLDGKMESAAKAIQAGAGSLSVTTDGSLKVDFSQMGINFKAGADKMMDSVDDGVKAYAKAQVKMLDSLIAMLEVVVAMQEIDLDIDDDNKISFGELFDVDGSGKIRTEVQQWINLLTSSFDIKVGEKSLAQALIDKLNPEQLSSFFNELYQIINNPDVDPATLPSQLQELIKKYFPKETVEVGEGALAKLSIDADTYKDGLYNKIKDAVKEGTTLNDFQKKGLIAEITKVNAELGNILTTLLNSNGNITVKDALTIAAIVSETGNITYDEESKKYNVVYPGYTGGPFETKEAAIQGLTDFIQGTQILPNQEITAKGTQITIDGDQNKVIKKLTFEDGSTKCTFNGVTLIIPPNIGWDDATIESWFKKNASTSSIPDTINGEAVTLTEESTGSVNYDIVYDAGTSTWRVNDQYMGKDLNKSSALKKYLTSKSEGEETSAAEPVPIKIPHNEPIRVTYTYNGIEHQLLITDLGNGNFIDQAGNKIKATSIDDAAKQLVESQYSMPETVSNTSENPLSYTWVYNGVAFNITIGENGVYNVNGKEIAGASSPTEAIKQGLAQGVLTLDLPDLNATQKVNVTTDYEYSPIEKTVMEMRQKLAGAHKSNNLGREDSYWISPDIANQNKIAIGAYTQELNNLANSGKVLSSIDLSNLKHIAGTAELGDDIRSLARGALELATTNEKDLKKNIESLETLSSINPDGITDLIQLLSSLSSSIESLGQVNIDNIDIEKIKIKIQELFSALVELKDETDLSIIVDISDALKTITDLLAALDGIKDKTVKVTTEYQSVTKSGKTIPAVENSDIKAIKTVDATGNLGPANAKGTLMGELGPELVVSNGRYFVAGQDGPEMIDLDDDAIVFNHLQTKSLLEKGMSSGRGKAVTNERNAVAFAHGNMNGGPAMASASAALATLKQLRSMWQSLLNASVKDFAGAGSGGGGGGGNTDKTGNFVKELEKWYNWLQEIAELEEQINYQEKLRSKIQSDMIPHGQDIATSYMTSLDALEKEIAVQEDLRNAQQEYFDQRRAWMNSNQNPFSSLYTFDENGQLKYANGKLEELSNMVGRNEEGKANYDAKEQYEMIQAMGYGDFLKYDSSGNEIELYQKDENGEYKLDEKGEKMVNADAYTTAVQAFWDKIDADKEEMQSLHDSINEHRDAVLEKQQAMNEILKSIEDNQIAVENKVLDAMVDSRERAIEESEKERAAIEKSSQSLIKGLSDQLNKERAMYEQQQDKNELNSLQRRLGILQRSGGSASEIASLQEQISQKQQDAYFDAQQNQIDALQEASDNELARLDAQIELAKETLEYEKTYGLLWQKVSDELAKSPTEIAQYIKDNNSDYWGKSRTDLAQTMREDLMEAMEFKKIQENFDVIAAYYKAFDDAANAGAKGKWTQDDQGRWQYQKANGDLAKNSWEKVDDKWYRFDENGYMQTGWVKDQDQWYHLDEKSGAMDTSWFHDKDDKWYYLDETSGAMLSNTTKQLMWNGEKANHSFDETGAWTGSTPIDKKEEKEEEKDNDEKESSNQKREIKYEVYQKKDGTWGYKESYKGTLTEAEAKTEMNNKNNRRKLTKGATKLKMLSYDTGGMVDNDQLALVHAKEGVLTAEQTSTLRNEILGNRNDSLLSLLTDFREAWSETKNAYSSITRDSSVVIEHAEVNMNVESIDNDYGAQRAGEQALNQMMQIARKTQAQNRVS